ncbi:MAG TPA: hypothetical protein VE977_13185, partial [Pyrinomonadaceae bacterium]|nr:hypothetical protein [Pyrinomonadaceae bacterium]
MLPGRSAGAREKPPVWAQTNPAENTSKARIIFGQQLIFLTNLEPDPMRGPWVSVEVAIRLSERSLTCFNYKSRSDELLWIVDGADKKVRWLLKKQSPC